MQLVLVAPEVISPTFVLAEHGREIGRVTSYPGPDFFWGYSERSWRYVSPRRCERGGTVALAKLKS